MTKPMDDVRVNKYTTIAGQRPAINCYPFRNFMKF